MRKKKFFFIKYIPRYSYAKFGTFFMGHPVYNVRWRDGACVCGVSRCRRGRRRAPVTAASRPSKSKSSTATTTSSTSRTGRTATVSWLVGRTATSWHVTRGSQVHRTLPSTQLLRLCSVARPTRRSLLVCTHITSTGVTVLTPVCLCEALCYTEVRPGLSGKKTRCHFREQR